MTNTESTTLTFHVDDYHVIENDLIAIYPEHYNELAVNKHRKKLKPDYARYRIMADQGLVHIPTARNAANELVGYWIFFVTPNLHYMDIKTAYNDIFYLRKLYRKGHNGLRFARFMLDSLKLLNVDEVYCGTKLQQDYGPIFERLGFAPIERIYTKLLDGSPNEGQI